MNILRYLVKVLGLGLVLSVVIAAVLIGIQVLDGRKLDMGYPLMLEIAYTCLYSVVLTAINAVFFDFVYRPGTVTTGPKRFLLGAVGSVVLTLAGIFLIRVVINVAIEGEGFVEFWKAEKLRFYILAFLITMTLSLFFHAFNFYKRYQEQKVKQHQIIAGTASAKFESLKNQIDPHFLFNSLNVLNALIDENPARAQKFTSSLSKVYRYVLEQKDKELVSLAEELAFAKTYMELLRMRFEDSLFFTLPEVDPNDEGKVVPLSLQLLLENTIKHNVVSPQRPLHIDITVKGDYLVVSNNLQKKEVLSDRNGVGLQNIVSRYALVTRRTVLIENDSNRFAVSIPVLTRQIHTVMQPENDFTNDYLRAQKKMEDIKGFYGHLASYAVTILILMMINLMTYPQHLWFLYPAAGWGIGVAFHYMAVFGVVPFLGSDWEERKIREILQKEEEKKWK